MGFSVNETKTIFSAITDLYKKGMTLEGEQKLIALKEAFLELKAENLELKLELHEIQESQSEKASMDYEAPFYYSTKDNIKDGPFCQKCYDADNKKIRLSLDPSVFGSHQCRVCRQSFGEASANGI